MSEDKEVKRLFAIARGHARTALAKPVIQRESYLGFCRLNWKRYAAGFSKSATECERFAAALDTATRDLVALIEQGGNPELSDERQRFNFLRDTVEGAMDSVIVHEAAYEPPEEPVTIPVAEGEVVASEAVGGEDSGPSGPDVVTAAGLDAILMQAESVTVEEMQAMADAIAGEAPPEPVADPGEDEPVRYGRPVFALGAAGAAPLGSIPQAPKPTIDDEALTDMLPKIRQIIGRKLRDGE